jgi:hypothetical protein
VSGEAHGYQMMNPAECRANAVLASETALLTSDPGLRAQWTETSAQWLRLAGMGEAQAALEASLLGINPED